MSSLIHKILAILCAVSICLPAQALCEVKLVSELSKGQKAPFKGILLSEDSAAKLFADIKFSKKECENLLTEKLEIQKIKSDAEINGLTLTLNIEKSRFESLLSVKDERIAYLEKNYLPPAWYETGEFWFAVGVLMGIGITVSAGYALGQAK